MMAAWRAVHGLFGCMHAINQYLSAYYYLHIALDDKWGVDFCGATSFIRTD